jgi:hypothetical protein
MFEWFERVGYSADIPSLQKTWGIRPLMLREWVATQKKTQAATANRHVAP